MCSLSSIEVVRSFCSVGTFFKFADFGTFGTFELLSFVRRSCESGNLVCPSIFSKISGFFLTTLRHHLTPRTLKSPKINNDGHCDKTKKTKCRFAQGNDQEGKSAFFSRASRNRRRPRTTTPSGTSTPENSKVKRCKIFKKPQ